MGCDSVSSRVKIIARKFWLISTQSRWSVNMMITWDFSEMGLFELDEEGITTNWMWHGFSVVNPCAFRLLRLEDATQVTSPYYPSFFPSLASYSRHPSLYCEWLQYTFSLLASFLFFNTVASAYRWNCLWCAVDIVVRFSEKHYTLYWVHHLSFWHCIFKTWIIKKKEKNKKSQNTFE